MTKQNLVFSLLSLLGLISTAPSALADGSSQTPINSTDLSAKNLSQVTSGNALLLTKSTTLTITALETTGNIASLTLKTTDQSSAQVTVTLAAETVKTMGIAVGQILRIVPNGAGSLLIARDKAIAFVPTELGKALIYSFPRN
jgi:hypothetical protein